MRPGGVPRMGHRSNSRGAHMSSRRSASAAPGTAGSGGPQERAPLVSGDGSPSERREATAVVVAVLREFLARHERSIAVALPTSSGRKQRRNCCVARHGMAGCHAFPRALVGTRFAGLQSSPMEHSIPPVADAEVRDSIPVQAAIIVANRRLRTRQARRATAPGPRKTKAVLALSRRHLRRTVWDGYTHPTTRHRGVTRRLPTTAT